MDKTFAYFKKGTPVNAVNAGGSLAITGVVVDGETFTINNSELSGSDVYEFVTDAAKTKTTPTNKVVDIAAYATKSTGTLTLATQPTAGDTMTIGGKLYTFIANTAAQGNGKIRVGTDLASAKVNVIAAINGTDTFNTANPKVTAGAFAVNDSTLTALVGGVVGDSIDTTETFTAVGNVFGAATLGSGADCSAANAITALVAAITASDTQGVGAADGAGDTIDFTADVAGDHGNRIIMSKVMANAGFPGTTASSIKLTGGVDGTNAALGTIMVDASYIYTCVAANTDSGKNWRRVSLGSAY